MKLKIHDIAACLELDGVSDADITVSSVETDSRKVQPGCLFICICGERVDGHDFANKAVELGAVGIVSEKELTGLPVPVLCVKNSVSALGKIAALWRSRTQARVIGITGTAGKTTVKEVLSQILSQKGETARNALNLNNQIGMPYSILQTTGNEKFWVFEAGISHDGDMDELASILKPDIAVILNAGAGHTEGLGNHGVAWHKARMLHYLSPEGRAFVCSDYDELASEASKNFSETEFFSSKNPSNDFYAAYMGDNSYAVKAINKRFILDTPFNGEYGAENIAAIVSVACALGLTEDEIKKGFASAHLPVQRFAKVQLNNWTLIDDSYNANPLSMTRMISASCQLNNKGCYFVMLGEMRELGEIAAKEHRKLGNFLAKYSPRAVFWKGGMFDSLKEGLHECGYTGNVRLVNNTEAFVDAVSPYLDTGGTILFKGSRSNHLEEMYNAFLNLLRQ